MTMAASDAIFAPAIGFGGGAAAPRNYKPTRRCALIWINAWVIRCCHRYQAPISASRACDVTDSGLMSYGNSVPDAYRQPRISTPDAFSPAPRLLSCRSNG
jgi:hypothetical protein